MYALPLRTSAERETELQYVCSYVFMYKYMHTAHTGKVLTLAIPRCGQSA